MWTLLGAPAQELKLQDAAVAAPACYKFQEGARSLD